MRAFVNSSGMARPVGLHGFGNVGNLGLINVGWCDSFEQAVEALGEVVRRAEAENATSSSAYQQAKSVLQQETGWNLFGRTRVSGVTNCEAQTARLASIIKELNAKLKDPITIPPVVLEQLKDAEERTQPTEPVPFWVKATVIGGIAVAGLIAVGVITGQVAPILKRL
jgi:hypothetical protein